MVVIIDAYNVLKYMASSALVSQVVIDRFIGSVGRRARMRRYSAIIVFDGGSSRYCTESVRDNLRIIHAGQGGSADDCIRELLDSVPADNTVLVTADRELQAVARHKRIITMPPPLWWAAMRTQYSTTTPPSSFFPKVLIAQDSAPGTESNEQLIEQLMEDAARAIPSGVIDRDEDRSAHAYPREAMSRRERTMQYFWNKL